MGKAESSSGLLCAISHAGPLVFYNTQICKDLKTNKKLNMTKLLGKVAT